jgi:hypothetical protein
MEKSKESGSRRKSRCRSFFVQYVLMDVFPMSRCESCDSTHYMKKAVTSFWSGNLAHKKFVSTPMAFLSVTPARNTCRSI